MSAWFDSAAICYADAGWWSKQNQLVSVKARDLTGNTGDKSQFCPEAPEIAGKCLRIRLSRDIGQSWLEAYKAPAAGDTSTDYASTT